MLSAKSDRSISEKIPIIREQNGCFLLKDESNLIFWSCGAKTWNGFPMMNWNLISCIFQSCIRPARLILKSLASTFPTDTIPQQRYFRHKLETTKNQVFLSHLDQCLQEAEWIQKNRTKREYYLFVFSENEEKRHDNISSNYKISRQQIPWLMKCPLKRKTGALQAE